jgi:hypothetical protein
MNESNKMVDKYSGKCFFPMKTVTVKKRQRQQARERTLWLLMASQSWLGTLFHILLSESPYSKGRENPKGPPLNRGPEAWNGNFK